MRTHGRERGDALNQVRRVILFYKMATGQRVGLWEGRRAREEERRREARREGERLVVLMKVKREY